MVGPHFGPGDKTRYAQSDPGRKCRSIDKHGRLKMRRRTFLAASAASLAMPAVARAENQRLLKFIPQSDLQVLDPVWIAPCNHLLRPQRFPIRVSNRFRIVASESLCNVLDGTAYKEALSTFFFSNEGTVDLLLM